jgi:hypothetical protein
MVLAPPAASTTTTTPIPEGSSATYILKAPSGTVCTIIRVDALLTFTYRDKVDEETVRTFILITLLYDVFIKYNIIQFNIAIESK